MKTIYEVIDSETAEIRPPELAAMPNRLKQMGCGRHEMYRDGDVLRCAHCPTHVYPGGLLYDDTLRWFEATHPQQLRRTA